MGTAQHIAKDDPEKIIISNIADFGWHAVNVIEDDNHPPWTYTIGFHETWGFPETTIIGRSRATAHHILNTIATGLDDNHRPDLSLPTNILIPGAKCFFLEVSPQYYSDYVGFARWYYRKRQFPLYQIIWPNGDGLYPWESQASRALKEWQPVLSNSSPPCDRDVATD
jgi:Domain of unknown function (DUF4262)